VYIDGKEKGRTPVIVRNISTGAHTVALKSQVILIQKRKWVQ
jgi:hypothetical protein